MEVKVMFSLPLFKKTLKYNYKLLLIFIGILAMYFSIIIGMYDPNDLSVIKQLAEFKFSPELLKAMGFTLSDTSLIGFLSSYFYGLLILAFPMIFNIILTNSLIAKQIEKGSMSYLLSSPNTRVKIVTTQLIFIIVSNILLIFFVTILGIILSNIMFGNLLDISKFITLNLGVLLIQLLIASIGFLSSCTFNDTKISLLFGAGIPIISLLLQMLANLGDKFNFLKNFTFFTLYDNTKIIAGDNITGSFVIILLISILLFLLGVLVFNKKDLHI
jgi:ABC-2 type transport system permease protein